MRKDLIAGSVALAAAALVASHIIDNLSKPHDTGELLEGTVEVTGPQTLTFSNGKTVRLSGLQETPITLERPSIYVLKEFIAQTTVYCAGKSDDTAECYVGAVDLSVLVAQNGLARASKHASRRIVEAEARARKYKRGGWALG